MSAKPPAVVFFFDQYPKPSERFLHRDLTGLVLSGVEGRVAAMKRVWSEPLPVASKGCYGNDVSVADRLRAWFSARWWATLFGALMRFGPKGAWLVARNAGLLSRLAARAGGAGRVHSAHAGWCGVVAWAASRMLRCPFSFSCHARDVFVQRTLLKGLAVLADKATSCNSEAFSVLQSIAPASCSTSLIRHSVPSLAARQVPAGEQPEILAVGRAVPKKDYRTLFAAFARVRERFPSARLVVAGATAQELGSLAEGIEAIGMVPFPMVVSLLGEATVLVHAARVAEDADRDGVPNVILEAMLTGTPVVASDAGAIRDVVRNGETGLLVPPGDIHLLSEAICSVLSDTASAATRAAAARALVLEMHSEAETIEKLRTFLNS